MTTAMIAYFVFGLLVSRMVRNRVSFEGPGWENEIHDRVCDRNVNYFRGADRNAACNGYGGCNQNFNTKRTSKAFVLFTPLLWPVYALCWFMLTEKLPRLPHRETNEEKFQRMLATDETFAGIYRELNDKYKVG